MTRYRIIYQNSNIEAPEGQFTIGRSIDCNLVLDDPSVSRFHASIIRTGDDLFLEDQGSRNGCSLNDKVVKGRVPLKDGDRIKIGHQVIHIVTVKQGIRPKSESAKNTMGLTSCERCGNWMSLEDNQCATCGTPKDNKTATSILMPQIPDRDDNTDNTAFTETRLPTIHSGQMLAGLIRKAISKKKLDEATRLTTTLLETTVKKNTSGQKITEEDLIELTDVVIQIATLTQSPQYISTLFRFFFTIQTLIPRKSVESLYETVRKVGYRTCPEMTNYLTLLGEMSRNFSPGEKFIHRRIEGLVGLCS